MTISQPQTTLRALGEGEDMGAIGLGILCKFAGETTSDRYSLFEYVVPPGLGGPPPHVHTRQDELFICVDGRVNVLLDTTEYVLEHGMIMMLPRGVRHQFWNSFDETTRIIAVVSPAGLEEYYRDLSALPPGPRDMAKVKAIMVEHGLQLSPLPDASA